MKRTKEQSLETRKKILDAARQAFLHDGVSNTSLEKIATSAFLTRGAVYWHFKNKTSLLTEVQADSLKPLIDAAKMFFSNHDNTGDPLEAISSGLEKILETLHENTKTLDGLKILASNHEHITDINNCSIENNSIIDNITSRIKILYTHANRQHLLNKSISPTQAAFETRIFFIGLIHHIASTNNKQNFHIKIKNTIQQHIRQKRMAHATKSTQQLNKQKS